MNTPTACPTCNSLLRDTFSPGCKSWAHDDWHEPFWRDSGPHAHESIPGPAIRQRLTWAHEDVKDALGEVARLQGELAQAWVDLSTAREKVRAIGGEIERATGSRHGADLHEAGRRTA